MPPVRAGIILHKARDVMNLQTQRVADTMRHKWPGQIVLNHRLFAHVFDNLMLTQQFSDALMELDVIIHVAGSGLHGANQRQLFVVHVFNQLRKIGIRIRRPYGSGLPHNHCTQPRVQQEATHLSRNLMIQFGVVQNRGMFIQRHDVAVRHVGIAVAGRRQVSLIDIELAHTGLERFVRRTVAIHRRFCASRMQ